MTTFEFASQLWIAEEVQVAWYFLTVPGDVSDEIRARSAGTPRGFGSVRVEVTIGSTTWSTSVFPDSKRGAYVLPVKKAVRTAEDLDDGSIVEVQLRLVGQEP